MKKNIWIILLILGLLPFIVVLIGSIYVSITGFGGLTMNHYYGFEAFIDWLILWSYIYWPSYIIGIVLILLSIIKLKNKR